MFVFLIMASAVAFGWILILLTPLLMLVAAPVGVVACMLSLTKRSSKEKPSILIVEDDMIWGSLMVDVFKGLDCEISYCSSGEEFVKTAGIQYDLVILDWKLMDMNAPEAIHKIDNKDRGGQFSNMPTILYSVEEKGKINIPKNSHFYQFDHWAKTDNQMELPLLAGKALDQLYYNKLPEGRSQTTLP